MNDEESSGGELGEFVYCVGGPGAGEHGGGGGRAVGGGEPEGGDEAPQAGQGTGLETGKIAAKGG